MIIATTQSFRTSALPAGAADNLFAPEGHCQLLFPTLLLPFEIVSLILLAAMVGALFLARETALEEERTGTDVTTPELVERPPTGRQLV